MPFTMLLKSPARPSLGDRQRRLSTEEANRIILIARRKSSDGSSQKDRNLRVFLGHAHIAETLKHEFADLDQPTHDSKTYSKPYSSSSSQHIQWADSYPRQSVPAEDEAMAFEDDGEEDFCSLALVRTPSRSAQPLQGPV
jgi:hypothetical protein